VGLLVGIFVIFLIGSGVRYGGRNHTPDLKTSCELPGLALSASELVRGSPLYYAVTGPDRTVVIAIDAVSLSPDLTPALAPEAREAQVIRVPTTMKGCKGKGVLGVQVPAGAHIISVFPAEGGQPLASKPLTVTDR
jgi:hypothetical protein